MNPSYFLYLEKAYHYCDDSRLGLSYQGFYQLQARTLEAAHVEMSQILKDYAKWEYPLKAVHLIEGQADSINWHVHYQRFKKKQDQNA